MSLIDRADIFDADLPSLGVRPVLVVTRQVAIPVLSSVTVAMITSTIREIDSEVALGTEQGLDHPCVANCDNLFTISKTRLLRRRGALGSRSDQLDRALQFALGLD